MTMQLYEKGTFQQYKHLITYHFIHINNIPHSHFIYPTCSIHKMCHLIDRKTKITRNKKENKQVNDFR